MGQHPKQRHPTSMWQKQGCGGGSALTVCGVGDAGGLGNDQASVCIEGSAEHRQSVRTAWAHVNLQARYYMRTGGRAFVGRAQPQACSAACIGRDQQAQRPSITCGVLRVVFNRVGTRDAIDGPAAWPKQTWSGAGDLSGRLLSHSERHPEGPMPEQPGAAMHSMAMRRSGICPSKAALGASSAGAKQTRPAKRWGQANKARRSALTCSG